MQLHLGGNIKFLRKKKGLNQSELADLFKKGHTTIGNWEKGISEPNLLELTAIVNYFEISANDLLYSDLSDVHLIPKRDDEKKQENVHLNVHPTVPLIGKKEPKEGLSTRYSVPPPNKAMSLEEALELIDILKRLVDTQENLTNMQKAYINDLQDRINELKEQVKVLQEQVKSAKIPVLAGK